MANSTSRLMALLICTLFSALLSVAPIWAQDSTDTKRELTYSQRATALEERIQLSLKQISQLEIRRAGLKGPAAQVFDQRIETVTREALEQAHKLVQLVIEREAAGGDPGPFPSVVSRTATGRTAFLNPVIL